MERVHNYLYVVWQTKIWKIFEWRWAKQSEAKGCHKIVLEFLDCVLSRENYQNNIQGRGTRGNAKKQKNKRGMIKFFDLLKNLHAPSLFAREKLHSNFSVECIYYRKFGELSYNIKNRNSLNENFCFFILSI